MLQQLLTISNLSVSVHDAPVLQGVSLSCAPGSIHWLIGPNGSGKSSLAMTILGHPGYKISSGTIIFSGNDIASMTADERARLGIFVTFQAPVDLPGVSVYTLLKEAYRSHHGPIFSFNEFDVRITKAARALSLELPLLQRPMQGFSGGQKKKLELLQLLVLEPKLAILDEVDAGLDIDACRQVGLALQDLRARRPETSLFLISHQQRLYDYIQPDVVHVMQQGTIIESGSACILERIVRGGFHERTTD